MDLGNFDSLSFIAPEFALIVTAVALLVLDRTLRDNDRLGDIALGGVALSLVAMALVPHEVSGYLFGGMLVHDPVASFFKLIFALTTMVTVWMSMGSKEVRAMRQGPYYSLLLVGAAGTYFMASAASLLAAYLAFEFLSISTYAITGFVHRNRRSKEAALKYLLYGSAASAAMLYGMSWIFGITGSLEFAAIHAILASDSVPSAALTIAFLLILVGLGFKVSMMPFHMWAPDVYSGAPLPVAAFLSVGVKAAGLALLLRILFSALSQPYGDGQWQYLGAVDWPRLFAVLAAASMTLGNLAALRQHGTKRMLAYSGVAHAGYLLMGIAAASDTGLEATMFYLLAYLLMNLGAFAVLLVVHDATGHADLEAMRGFAWRGGAVPAAAMAVFLLSLIGLPPFVGFFAKLFLFAALIEQEMYVLAGIGVANVVVSMGYYLQILRAMFLEAAPPDAAAIVVPMHDRMLLVFLAIATTAFGLWSGPLHAFTRYSLDIFTG